ncbi:Mitochondrial import inner membrane translocase subunit TIM50 [Babesia sp. Xinjiang]|uniref:Mitochondrial import inner membrane translocase subunit TIM50 n=1 Tax=Babesia sp. Xinjiang TaxID=462227 RepID=UPI000A21DD5D|nr:Mitochondrial import inner membrane translocase subunit TIM50 [Babesia sp. Xinjiang]XP_028872034.1 Mitochondrial import inner membrane translocase subunit TIM50 [Babesia sp. Xinjiang]ORM41554.1 Mitochondrial import inner membrane translocase subunit TIM50 [Babesia sp. Xinjiang]ORM41578.1 Mitochondrial import inner membrane translocase subunit TIM50 [Babesia sp. Xinjiang]
MALLRGLLGFNPGFRLISARNFALYTQSMRNSKHYNLWYPVPQWRPTWAMLSCCTFSTSNPTATNTRSTITTDGQEGDATVLEPTDDAVENEGKNTAPSRGDRSRNDGNQDQSQGTDSKTKGKHKLFLPFGIVGSASIVLAGYFISVFRREDEELMTMLERGLDRIVEHMNGMFSNDDGPLLPDVKDLNYPPNLPTLVVDLDKVVAKLEYDRRTGWQVKKRPFADRFFRELVNYYEIVVWSDDNYPMATDVANRWGLPVIGCIHRDRCTKFKGSYIKDLSKLGRNLNRVILVDHDRMACMLQEENAILVREFDGDENDRELLHLLGLLKSIALNPQDVKQQLKNHGGGLDRDIGRRFSEKNQQDTERAKARQSLSKLLGFKHF